jgi:hypothetical protein
MSKLFHKDIYLPAFLGDLNVYRPMSVMPTRHALEASLLRGFRAPRTIPAGATVIEVEVGSHGSIDKIVYRFGFDKTNDLVAVVRGNRLITCWLNAKADKHSTLDRTKYQKRAA